MYFFQPPPSKRAKQRPTEHPVEAGQLVAVLTESLSDAPWLGKVKEVYESNYKIVWMEGTYDSVWRQAAIKKGKKHIPWVDTIARETVILSGIKLNKDNKLSSNVVELLKETYSSYF